MVIVLVTIGDDSSGDGGDGGGGGGRDNSSNNEGIKLVVVMESGRSSTGWRRGEGGAECWMGRVAVAELKRRHPWRRHI